MPLAYVALPSTQGHVAAALEPSGNVSSSGSSWSQQPAWHSQQLSSEPCSCPPCFTPSLRHSHTILLPPMAWSRSSTKRVAHKPIQFHTPLNFRRRTSQRTPAEFLWRSTHLHHCSTAHRVLRPGARGHICHSLPTLHGTQPRHIVSKHTFTALHAKSMPLAHIAFSPCQARFQPHPSVLLPQRQTATTVTETYHSNSRNLRRDGLLTPSLRRSHTLLPPFRA